MQATLKKFPSTNNHLWQHLKGTHPPKYLQLKLASPFTRIKKGEDGDVIRLMTFDESLPHHVRFVLWCIVKKRPFELSRDSEFREFAEGLSPRYTPPHRETCVRIMDCLYSLVDAARHKRLEEARAEIGTPFAGAQLDLWTSKNSEESYACLVATILMPSHDP
jgi:hypothetical protein